MTSSWLAPTHFAGNERAMQRHRSVARVLCALSAFIFLLFLAHLAAFSETKREEVWLFIVASALPVLGIVWIRLIGDIEQGLAVALVTGILLVSAWAWHSGGIVSPAAPWLLVAVSSFGLFQQDVYRLVLVLLAAAMVLMLYLASTAGVLPPSFMRADEQSRYALISLFGACVVIALIARAIARERGRRFEQLRQSLLKVERAQNAKDVVLGGISHEFRTPLSIIVGSAEAMADEPWGAESPHVPNILAAAEEVDRLVARLLDMARVEAGDIRIAMDPVEVLPMWQAVCRKIKASAHGERFAVNEAVDEAVAAGHITVRGDEGRLAGVIEELAADALQCGGAAGQVALRLRALDDGGEEAGRVAFEIECAGVEMPESSLTHIFEPFSRVPSRSAPMTGMGTRMAVCRRLVEFMGGRIGVDRSGEHSLLFWFSLPASFADRAQPAA